MRHKPLHSKFYILNSRKGFTLIEVLIYSALLAIFFGGSISLMSDILDSSGGVSERTELLSAQEFLEKKLDWAISSAKEIQEPLANATSGVLRLVLDDVSSTQITFSQGTSTLQISTGGGAAVELTNSRVDISDFSVFHISSPNSPPQLKISFIARSTTGKNYVASSSLLYVFQR